MDHMNPSKQWWYNHNKIKHINTLRPRQNGRYFADDIIKCIFLNENVWISLKISLKFVPKGSINNIPALVQIMVWRRPGNKPLSEPMMVSLLTHICVTRPQWVNSDSYFATNTGLQLRQMKLLRVVKLNHLYDAQMYYSLQSKSSISLISMDTALDDKCGNPIYTR